MAHFIYSMPIILASTSPARHQLLTAVGVEHTVVPAPINEEQYKQHHPHLSLPEQARYLAQAKAQVVSQYYPQHLVIGADQIGELDKKALFKPGNKAQNIVMLQQLRNQTHQQHTAVAICQNQHIIHTLIASPRLHMRALTDAEITAYVEHDQPWNCCGGYRFEGLGKHLFNHIDGDFDAILGLPLVPLLAYLHQANYLRLVASS